MLPKDSMSTYPKGAMVEPMDDKELFFEPVYEQQTHMAERELSAFIGAVTELFGPEQARASAEDRLEESELTDSPPVDEEKLAFGTIAASARLAERLNAAEHRQTTLSAWPSSKVSPMLSSNCFASILLL
jgi:hypothetical protein